MFREVAEPQSIAVPVGLFDEHAVDANLVQAFGLEVQEGAVEIALPVLGRIVAYRGWLEPAE